jgi:predicted membrane channel-forming protein YqfA (hemolysin III family)
MSILPVSDAVFFWGLMLVQLIGLASATIARLSERSAAQAWCQRFFFVCLGFVGLAAMLALACDSGYFLSCGTTLSLMAVGTTLDMQNAARATAF